MRVTDIEVPKGVDRLSSADFRLLLASHMQSGGATSPSGKGKAQGRGKYSQKVLNSLPDRMRVIFHEHSPTWFSHPFTQARRAELVR